MSYTSLSVPSGDSILITVKKTLGLLPEQTVFDPEIIVFINSAIFQLQQLGVGPDEGFVVTTDQDVWDDLLNGMKTYEAAKTYIYTKVRLLFDPPTSANAQEALNKIAEELGWRLYVEANPIQSEE